MDQRRHPPPLLISHDGLARYLTDGHGILLGTGVRTPRTDATVPLPPGSTLLLYTDGLIEAPGQTLDEGLQRLRRHAAALAHRPLASFTDQVLRRVRHVTNDDDVALLAVRAPSEHDPDSWSDTRQDARAAPRATSATDGRDRQRP